LEKFGGKVPNLGKMGYNVFQSLEPAVPGFKASSFAKAPAGQVALQRRPLFPRFGKNGQKSSKVWKK